MSKQRISIMALIGLGLVLGSTAEVSAATWRQTHPRRAEVNHRLANQNLRIHRNLKEGNITQAEAARLHGEVHGVRVEERQDAAQHGRHITRAERRDLNQDANTVSRDIYNAAH